MNSILIAGLLARVTDPAAPVDEPTEEPTDDLTLEENVEQAVNVTFDIVNVVFAVLVGIAVGVLVAVLLQVVAKMLARRHPIVEPSLGPTRSPFLVLMGTVGAWIAFTWRTEVTEGEIEPGWRHPLFHAGMILVILAGTWFIASIVVGFEASVVRHVERTGAKRAKRIQTQFQIVRRVLVVVVWTLGLAGVLITFPTARAAGASIIASAGIISVIAGLAAQSTLGNVFAGLQVAFSDSLRVDDIVIMDGEYCVVEEITLTYVVLKVWDGRRIIVPSGKLTSETFENWTRRDALMMGKIFFDLDWQVPIDAMRSEMNRVLQTTDLWDRRTAVLQVDSAENGGVKIAILVSAEDSATLTDLRNFLREHMVKWVQKNVPRALPYSRNVNVTLEELREAIREYPDPETFVDPEETVEPPKPKFEPEKVDLQETVVLPANYLPFRRSLSERSPQELPEESLAASPTTVGVSTSQVRSGHESSIFSGSPEAEERAKAFAGPGKEAIAEREKRAAMRQEVGDNESDTDEQDARDDDRVDETVERPIHLTHESGPDSEQSMNMDADATDGAGGTEEKRL